MLVLVVCVSIYSLYCRFVVLVLSETCIVLEVCSAGAKRNMDCRFVVLYLKLLTYQSPVCILIVSWIACLLCWVRIAA